MRRRLSYANVAATLALVFSTSGGALAAGHYLISSTKQISPKVLKTLKGQVGAKGAAGTPGEPGAKGEKGERGEKGEAGPSHAYSVEGAEGSDSASITVPAGTYVVSGTGELYTHEASKDGFGGCRLAEGGTTLDERYSTVAKDGFNDSGAVYGGVQIPNQATVTLNSPETLTEACEEFSDSEAQVFVQETNLTAIQVAALN